QAPTPPAAPRRARTRAHACNRGSRASYRRTCGQRGLGAPAPSARRTSRRAPTARRAVTRAAPPRPRLGKPRAAPALPAPVRARRLPDVPRAAFAGRPRATVPPRPPAADRAIRRAPAAAMPRIGPTPPPPARPTAPGSPRCRPPAPGQRAVEPDRVVLAAVALPVARDDLLPLPRATPASTSCHPPP